MAQEKSRHKPIPIVALCLAWLVPGAGHVYVGRLTRGIIIFVVISATFWAGVAMGGVMTVDPQRQRWWFIAEMFSGVHGIVGWQAQRRTMRKLVAAHPLPRRVDPRAHLEEILAEEKLALVLPTASVARAYGGVAGLLNLMCMFEVLMLSIAGITGEPPPRKAAPP